MHIPKYRRHVNGQAFLYHKSIPTKTHRLYLGRYGSAESERKYQQFVKRLLSADAAGPAPVPVAGMTVDELILRYTEFAGAYYARDGQPTKEFTCVVAALRPVSDLFGDEMGRDFGPKWLMFIQHHLVQKDYERKEINKRVGRIKRFVRWCCKNELLPAETYSRLECVDGLRRGRSGARESNAILPVAKEVAFAVLPYVSPQVSAMIQLQYYGGMRPGEVTIMRPCDIEKSEAVWLYQPSEHKNEHRGHKLVKAIPRVAQHILEPFLDQDADRYMFSPIEAEEWRNARKRETRKTPLPRKKKQGAGARRPALREIAMTHRVTVTPFDTELRRPTRTASRCRSGTQTNFVTPLPRKSPKPSVSKRPSVGWAMPT